MYIHPLRAYLRDTGLARFVRRTPALYWLAVRVWRMGQRVKSVLMAPKLPLLFAPLMFLLVLFALFVPRRRQLPPLKSGKRDIVMLVISEVFRDPRVEREARALAAAGFPVKILYPDAFSFAYGIGPLDWGPGISFLPLPASYANFTARFPYVMSLRFLYAAMQETPFAFHAHDLSTSAMALAAARVQRARCVCDFHEWYSENVTWNVDRSTYEPHPRLKRWIYEATERAVLRQASAVVTVCESIAAELSAMVDPARNVVVIRNIPRVDTRHTPRVGPSLRAQLKVPSGSFLLLYQGGVGPSRLLEPVIDSLAHAPGVVLVLRGPGIEHYRELYEQRAARLGVADRLHCLPPVPSSEVVSAARDADAGIWTLPNLCKNFSYALPNKLFEYLAAGLPVLSADYPEVRRIVERYGVGLLFDPYSPESIAGAAARLARDGALARQLARNTTDALLDMRADREWDKLVEVYRALAENHPRREAAPTEEPAGARAEGVNKGGALSMADQNAAARSYASRESATDVRRA